MAILPHVQRRTDETKPRFQRKYSFGRFAVVAAAVSGYAGLVVSFQTRVPSGPAIILVATVLYIVSVLFGRVGGIVRQLFPGRHLEA